MSQKVLVEPVCRQIVYRIVEDTYFESTLGEHTGYGVAAFDADEELISYYDVTCNRDWLEALVQRMNEGELALVHFYDVLVDSIG